MRCSRAMWNDPSRIDLAHEIRTISFENPNGAKGAAGTAHGGRKGAPNKLVAPGERIVLAEIAGPGRVRHVWMTFPPMPPEALRALLLEVTYDDAREPSVAAPCLDFFGLPHGRPVPYAVVEASFLGERLTPRRLLGVAVGLAGLTALFNPLALDWTDRTAVLGNLAILAAALL